MYLSEEQIVDLLIEYILDKRYTQAILIEGDWGSGKTFFVQGKLLNELSKRIGTKTEHKQKIIYISLYGIEKIQQIMDEIYASLMESFFDEKIHEGSGEAIGRSINFISKVASAGLKHFDVDTKDLPKITELNKLKNSILIFDDLERCNISINQIFGFINNLVEHNDIKVIIVSNQAEIGKMELSKELAQKYSVVLNENLSLQTDDEKKTQASNNQEKNEDTSINKDKLIKYTDRLFSNDVLYEKIKEKLIGITIFYRSNLNSIYESILQKYIVDEEVKIYLLAKKDVVLNICESKEHYNIRTLIFAIMAFEKIAIMIKEIEFEPIKYIDEQQENILKYCITLSIYLKLGKKPYSWKNDTIKSGNISLEGKYLLGKYIFGYKFIDDYLLYRSFNYEEIKEILIHLMEDNKKNNEYKESQNSLSFNKLEAWWELEDEEIKSKLRVILQEIEEGKYHPRFFKSIIITLMQLKYNGFETIIYGDYVSKMKIHLEEIQDDFNQEYLEACSDDKEFLDEYYKIVSPLINILKIKKNEQREGINNCLSTGESWGEEFYKYCCNHREQIMLDKKFFFHLDVQKVIEKIEKSMIKDLYGLLAGIREIYSFSNLNDIFKADINNLNEIITELDVEKLSYGKITKRVGLVKIKNKLEESLKLIKQ
ncbi:P-loop NTPase fold protein [Clostridium estertheticum]|uniref:P-loop NTPase fold protein n=1 Tax=Clostridium estertheticum TaxID=238834 RepID=UPI001C7D76DB|nr:P-loop NTPase fold protein [Clostridium estertheticum]MBX4266208.1 KAP family NTPase [Clostridium estertheticum]WLC89911.1 KAP family NTPase [Clostridium estertheticum]